LGFRSEAQARQFASRYLVLTGRIDDVIAQLESRIVED
jgi:hypothetical protein